MHRKFIALIVATAIAITGVSVSQARAADARDILGGLAAIALIGAGVHYYNKEKDKARVSRTQPPVYHANPSKPHYPVRPLPRRVANLQHRVRNARLAHFPEHRSHVVT